MKLKLTSLLFSFFTFFFGLFFATPVFADTFTLSGTVKDNTATAIEGATVNVYNVGTTTDVVTPTTTDQNGNYSFPSVQEGTYSVQVTPSAGSGYASVIAFNQIISANKILNFILTPAGTLNVSGKLVDASGNAVSHANFSVTPQGSTSSISSTTDDFGNYSFTGAPGIYQFSFSKQPTDPLTNLPRSFQVTFTRNFTTSLTNFDITVPARQVTVHVEDNFNVGVEGVKVEVWDGANRGSADIGSGITDGTTLSRYILFMGNIPATDENGDVVLWITPNDQSSLYRLVAIPPSGSPFNTTTLSNVNITNNTTDVYITLNQPITISGKLIDLSGDPVVHANFSVTPQGSTSSVSSTTDEFGNYSFTGAPGTYEFSFFKQPTDPLSNLPRSFQVTFTRNFTTSLTNFDITVPARQIVVNIHDSTNIGVEGVRVEVWDGANRGSADIGSGITNGTTLSRYISFMGNIPSTDSDGNVTLWITPNDQSSFYRLVAIPPSGSIYDPTTVSNVNITNTTTDISITLNQSITISGRLVDASGNAVSHANFSVTPQGSTSSISSTTDDFGNYSFTGAPGIYQFSFSKQPTDPLTNLPRSFQVTFTRNFTTSLTNFDITVPARQVIVHVQDSTNIGVEGVRVEVWDGANRGSADIGSGITNGTTLSRYISFMGNIPATDENGDVILWITPNDQSSLYRLVAIPPSGSPFNTFTLNNVSILGEQTEIISLQYNHATPVTTIDLATEHQDGTYSNPTTVTLSATADTGYTIANTFYKVDGGAQQTYTGPFTVSGNGDHSVEYWSVDNSGVQESHKTKNFTIYTNQAPYVDPFPGASINAGETYTATGSFSDPDSISWTATVDYDEGAGPEPLTLNPDKTFNLSHQYATPGEYQVVVEVRDDGQATGQTVATIYVNGAPEIAALSDEEVNLQDTFMQDGSFTDDDSTSWTATVDYGDGTGEQDLILNPDKTFHLEYTYQQADTYTVIVRIRDNQGAGAMADFEVVVNSPPVIDPLPDVSLQEGGTYTAPGSFTDDDSTNWTATVNYAEGAGIESLPLNPDNTFSLSNLYEENGTYNVAVRITDDKGAFAIETLTVTVNNASPQVEAITASVNPIQVNTSTTATVTFTDAGVFDTHTAVWNWGDGQTTNCPSVDCTLNGANGVWTVSVSHTYTAADVYEINLTVTDDDTGSGQAPPYQYLSVYNPTPQGLFTGVRIYNTGNGQVQFGISAKYQNNVATGDISMNFNAGNIEFESTGITALVITNGNKATVTGNGTVNGQSGYTFLVVGLDGGPGGDDFVRFQIKNGATVIYDSQPGAADTANPTTSVTAGQVIVH